MVLGKIYARLIYKGKMTITDVPPKFQQDTKLAYKELFGAEIK